MFDSMDALGEKLRDAVRAHTERYSWTELQTAYLGDGNDPPTVVVPQDKALFKGAVYYYTDPLDNTTVSQAIGWQLGADLNELTLFAGQPIEVGKPENSRYTHARVSLQTIQSIGGASPQQITSARKQMVTPDRFQELRMYASGTPSMTPLMTQGKARIGNTLVLWLGGNTVDLTSYIPATSGRAVWVLVSIGSGQTFDVQTGTEFIASATNRSNPANLPKTAVTDFLQLAWVYLPNGITALTNDNFINIANIPNMASVAATVTPNNTLVDDNDTILVDDSGDTLLAS